jgi:hypothetical protein
VTAKTRPAARERGLGKIPISVPRPVHDRLTALRQQISDQRGRTVTYPEVLEQLLDAWDRAGGER